jgi:thiol-disulfide isomerase/thioredoxin
MMSRGRRLALYAVVAVAAATAGAGVQVWRSGLNAPPITPMQLKAANPAEAILALRLPDPQGKIEALEQWRGKVLVVNFWATWCAPCREEIPMFIKMQDKYRDRGVQFVGVSIDQPDKTAQFTREFAINYPILIGGFDVVDKSRDAGNEKRGLPFTLVFDRSGAIHSAELGGLKQEKLEPKLLMLLENSAK